MAENNNQQQPINNNDNSNEIIDSLISLRQVSLLALNNVVKRIVTCEETSPTTAGNPEYASITALANPEGNNDESATTENIKNLPTALKKLEISRSLNGLNKTSQSSGNSNERLNQSANASNADSPITSTTSDHGLALALAALCSGIYQLIDAANTANRENVPPAELFNQIRLVQNQRPSNSSGLPEEQRRLWEEMDRLMVAIQAICQHRESLAKPPTYEEATTTTDYYGNELDGIYKAIDRVFQHAPRLNRQDVVLSERQARNLSVAELLSLIDKISRHSQKFTDQRADMNSNSKFAKLNTLVGQITKAHARSMTNQRADMSIPNKEKLEFGKITKVIDAQSKRRYENQDWTSPEQRLVEDLGKLQTQLENVKSGKLNNQRFELSEDKAKTLQMGALLSKVDKLEGRRMANQDAMSISDLKDKRFDELDRIMDRMSTGLDSQRVEMRKTKSSGSNTLLSPSSNNVSGGSTGNVNAARLSVS